MKKLKNISIVIIAVICYYHVRILSMPVYWIGIPALEYWLEDSEKATRQIRLIVTAWILFLQVYLFGWVGVISSILWLLVGFLYLWFKKREKK